MKQTVRFETFETNSSSYHSVSIHRKSFKEEPKLWEIIVGQPTELDGVIKYKTIGCTSSYTYTSRTKLDKANMLLRLLDGTINDWVWETEEYKNLPEGMSYEDKKVEKRKIALNCPILLAMKEVIQEYTQSDVTFKFTNTSSGDFFPSVYPEDFDIETDLGVYDIENMEQLTTAFKKIIFDDDFEITEDCESNE